MIQPEQIVDEIQKRPPLQRASAEESYRGIKISWKLRFKGGRQVLNQGNKWEIYGAPENDFFPHIYFEIDKEEYPEVNILHENSIFWVEGEISKVGGLSIYLVNSLIRWNENSEELKSVPVSNTFVNSQVHFGSGNNIDRSKIVEESGPSKSSDDKKWYEKLLWQIIGIISTVITAAIIYYAGWN